MFAFSYCSPKEKDSTNATRGPTLGAIRVGITVLWQVPVQGRDYDRLILQKNNDPAAWAGGMDVHRRLWLVDKAVTTALLGEPVIILDRQGEWVKVAAIRQKTSIDARGYPGWVPKDHIVSNDTYNHDLETRPHVVVMDRTAGIFKNPGLTDQLAEASYMTRLPMLKKDDRVITIRLPGGNRGYLYRGCTNMVTDLHFSRAGIIEEAKRFIDLPYIWAGTSAYGFDCSGFVMRLYQSQGISIARDADEQALAGTAVAIDNLELGDLVFYAGKGGVGPIHHVAMYAGDGMIIHSPNSNFPVTIQALDSSPYGEEYWGARRYFD
ncbi:MAG: C40 family peptidase [Peptococcaceae bacterium]|nr:C40 family peptidase [Peptococcaceae bacterium]